MNIKIWSGRIQYEFNITEKYTILKGDSATGKTTLCSLIADIGEGVTVSSPLDIFVLSKRKYDVDIYDSENSIIVIDEDNPILKLGEKFDLGRMLSKSNNYFIIICREELKGIPASIESMSQLKISGTYHRFVPLYEDQEIKSECYIDSILCEDEKSGKIFLESYFDCAVVSAKGKDSLIKMLNTNKTDDLLVFYDSLSMGYLEEYVIKEKNKRIKNTYLFRPKCFEKYIIDSMMFNIMLPTQSNVQNLEKSYEAILDNELPLGYSKSRLSFCLIKDCGTFNHAKCSNCSLYIKPGKKRRYLIHSGLELVKVKDKENKLSAVKETIMAKDTNNVTELGLSNLSKLSE